MPTNLSLNDLNWGKISSKNLKIECIAWQQTDSHMGSAPWEISVKYEVEYELGKSV